MKPILDACCGGRMFWFDRNNPNAVFIDTRSFETTLCDGRKMVVSPDEIMDFRHMDFPDKSFKLVVFDPPHLGRAVEKSLLAHKYGVLPKHGWQEYLRDGVYECMRVLDDYGVLIFKWNEDQIKVSEVIKAIEYKPLFGDRRAKTIWMCFMKIPWREI